MVEELGSLVSGLRLPIWPAWPSAGLLLEAGLATAVWRQRARRPRRPVDLGALAALALVGLDWAYELRSPTWPRYPCNYWLDGGYLLALGALAWALWPALASGAPAGPRRLLPFAGASLLAVGAAAAQGHFLLGPLWAIRPAVPPLGRALAAAYALGSAGCAALVGCALWRARRGRDQGAAQAVGLLWVGDLAARHAALACPASSQGAGTWAWSVGLCGLLVCGGRRCPRPAPLWQGRHAFAPWASLQVLLSAVATLAVALLPSGLMACGLLRVRDATDFSHLLLLVFGALAVVTLLARLAGQAVRQAARALPAATGPQAAAAAREPWLLELRLWWRAHRRLLAAWRRLVAREASWRARGRRLQLRAELAHDLQAPLAAMEAAWGSVHEPAAARRLLGQAVRRARHLSRQLLRPARAPRGRPIALSAAVVWTLVEQAAAEARLRHGPRAAQLICRWRGERHGAHERLRACPLGLAAVLGALLDNAIEAAPRSAARVVLTVAWPPGAHGAPRGRPALLTVRDEGPGLPVAWLAAAGRRRLPSGKPGGHGLGLCGAGRRMRAMGGRLHCRPARGGGLLVVLACPIVSPGARS